MRPLSCRSLYTIDRTVRHSQFLSTLNYTERKRDEQVRCWGNNLPLSLLNRPPESLIQPHYGFEVLANQSMAYINNNGGIDYTQFDGC